MNGFWRECLDWGCLCMLKICMWRRQDMRVRIGSFFTQTLSLRRHSGDWIRLHERMEIEIWIGVANACVGFHIRAKIFSSSSSEHVRVCLCTHQGMLSLCVFDLYLDARSHRKRYELDLSMRLWFDLMY